MPGIKSKTNRGAFFNRTRLASGARFYRAGPKFACGETKQTKEQNCNKNLQGVSARAAPNVIRLSEVNLNTSVNRRQQHWMAVINMNSAQQ